MRRFWCWMTASAVIALAASSAAQAPPDDAAKSAARGLAQTGKQRFEAGKYAEAIEAFRDAEKYFSAPTIKRMRAQSHEKLGQLLEARDIYTQMVAEQLAADAPTEFWEAKEDAKKRLQSLETRIPRVEITVAHAPSGTRVTLDGKALDAAVLAQPLRLNPGKYTIVIKPPGKASVTRSLDLKEGGTEKVDVDLAPPPSPPAITTIPVVAPASGTTSAPTVPAGTSVISTGPASAEPAAGRSFLGPAIAFGVGGAGLMVGAITGGLTLAKAGEIRALCGEDMICPKGTESQVGLEGAKGIGYVSTAAFALAGAGAIAGVLLLVLPGGKKTEPATAISLGPGFVGVKGAF